MDTYQFEYTPTPKWGTDKIIRIKFAYDPEYNERFTPEVVEEFIVQVLNKYAQKAPVVEGFSGREILRFVAARVIEFSIENEGMWKTIISRYMTSKGKTDYLGNEIKSVFKQLRRYTPSTGSAGLRSRTAGATGASASASAADTGAAASTSQSTGSPRQTTGPQLTPEGVESIRHSMLASSRRTRVRHVGRDTSRMKFKPIGGRK
jgi:hypothetical protein